MRWGREGEKERGREGRGERKGGVIHLSTCSNRSLAAGVIWLDDGTAEKPPPLPLAPLLVLLALPPLVPLLVLLPLLPPLPVPPLVLLT